MKTILLVGVVFFLIFMGCNTQKNNVMESENNNSIEKVDLSFIKDGEIISKNIDKEYWETILNIIKTAEYDVEQYDEIKNPLGYMMKVIAQDYILKIFYTNNTVDEIFVWRNSDRIKINGKWHTIKTEREELVNILDSSRS